MVIKGEYYELLSREDLIENLFFTKAKVIDIAQNWVQKLS